MGNGTITTMSCDVTTNGYQPTNDYVLGLTNEQVTEVAIQNGVPSWQHTNVMADGMLVATYDTVGWHFYLNDPLGSRRAQTDAAGQWEQNCLSLPYGDQLSCTMSISAPTEHHFTGKERDTESGLDYFGARYMASSMGRFMSPDWAAQAQPVPYAKLDDPQSLNLYAYVGNNPLSRTDPDGHLASPWHFIITYAAAVATGTGPFHGVFSGFGKAAKNVWVDFRKGSQGTDAAHTDMHDMRGTKPDGSTQTTAEARAGAAQIITDAIKSGDTGLGGHVGIDAATPLHDGHIWDGGGLNMDTVKHELGDFFPSPGTIKHAYENEKSVLQGVNPLAPTPAPAPAPTPAPTPPPPTPEPKPNQQ